MRERFFSSPAHLLAVNPFLTLIGVKTGYWRSAILEIRSEYNSLNSRWFASFSLKVN